MTSAIATASKCFVTRACSIAAAIGLLMGSVDAFAQRDDHVDRVGAGRLEVLLAGYQSAATGAKVDLPFRPNGVARPVDLWLARKEPG